MRKTEHIELDDEDEKILDRIAQTRPARGEDYDRRIRSMHREAVWMLRDERREAQRRRALQSREPGPGPETEPEPDSG